MGWLKEHRRHLAYLVFAATGIVVVASYLPFTGIESCHGELANTGTVVSVCGPIGLSDVVAVSLVLLLGLALLWDDLSEFSVGSLLTIKRRVEAVEKKLDVTTAQAEDDIRALTLAQPAPEEAVVRGAVEALREDVRAAADQGAAHDATVVVEQNGRRLSGARAASEAELVQLARTIDLFLRVLGAEERPGSVRLLMREGVLPATLSTDEAYAAVVRWSIFSESYLPQWIGIRNTVLHTPERMSDEDVRLGVDLGNLLTQRMRYEVKQARQ